MASHEMTRHAVRTRASMEHLFILITMGDLLGVPIVPPYYSLRLLPYVTPQSPIQRIREFARGRGWHYLRLVSSAKNTYNRDYHAESGDEKQDSIMNVFTRRNGKVHHFWASEARFVPEPGGDPRHLDLLWPLWNALDVTPEGRGQGWYPKLAYEQ